MNPDALCLFAACAYLRPADLDAPLKLPPEQELDALFFEVSREGLAGFLASALAQSAISDDVRAKALERFKGDTVRNLQWLSELARLDRAFSKADCDAIVLKGAVLLHHGYQSRLGVRFLSDIDLMVRECDLAQVAEVLEGLGYRSGDGINFYHQDSRLSVDLHTDPIKRVATAFNFCLEQLWRDRLPLDEARYARLCRLGREDHYLHLAIHALKHGYERLSWLVDLAVVREDFDAEILWQKARDSGSERVLAYTFFLLDRLFLVPTPVFFQERLPRLHLLERLYLQKVMARESPRTLGKLVPIFSIPSWRMRLVHLWKVSAPQAAGMTWSERLRELRRMAVEALYALWPLSR